MTARIRIPDPALVVLIGPAGAGKTTFARRWFAPSDVLSSDRIRGEIGRSEADQRVSRAAFGRLHEELAGRLSRGLLTVVDATNVQPHARRALLVRRANDPMPTIAIVFDIERDTIHARNAARTERVVPADVVDRQLAALARSGDDARLHAEGFDVVYRIRSAEELDAVEVERAAVPG